MNLTALFWCIIMVVCIIVNVKNIIGGFPFAWIGLVICSLALVLNIQKLLG